jgi:hypothetical protein
VERQYFQILCILFSFYFSQFRMEQLHDIHDSFVSFFLFIRYCTVYTHVYGRIFSVIMMTL